MGSRSMMFNFHHFHHRCAILSDLLSWPRYQRKDVNQSTMDRSSCVPRAPPCVAVAAAPSYASWSQLRRRYRWESFTDIFFHSFNFCTVVSYSCDFFTLHHSFICSFIFLLIFSFGSFICVSLIELVVISVFYFFLSLLYNVHVCLCWYFLILIFGVWCLITLSFEESFGFSVCRVV